jgi:hypothetical protein
MRRRVICSTGLLVAVAGAGCSTSSGETEALEARIEQLESQLAPAASPGASSSTTSIVKASTTAPTTTTTVTPPTTTTVAPTTTAAQITTTTAPPTTTTADLGPVIHGAALDTWMAWGGLPTTMQWIGDWQAFRRNFATIGSATGARASCSWFADDNFFPFPGGRGVPPYLRDTVAAAPDTETRAWISNGLDHSELAIQLCMAGDFTAMTPVAAEADRLLGGGQDDLRDVVFHWRDSGGPVE